MFKRSFFAIAAVLWFALVPPALAQASGIILSNLRMYYAIHGAQTPLALLDDAFAAIETRLARLLPVFAIPRQVVVTPTGRRRCAASSVTRQMACGDARAE